MSGNVKKSPITFRDRVGPAVWDGMVSTSRREAEGMNGEGTAAPGLGDLSPEKLAARIAAMDAFVKSQDLTRDLRASVEEVDEKKGVVQHIISDDTTDYYGTVITAGAFEESLARFRDKGVVLWMHGQDFLRGRKPVGNPTEGYPQYTGKAKKKLRSVTQFDMGDPFNAEVFRMYAGRIMQDWSVGFRIPKDGWSEEPVREDQTSITIWKATLLEYSAVHVGANPNTETEKIRGLVRVALGGVPTVPVFSFADDQEERVTVTHKPPGDGFELQSILFVKEKWTVASAKSWLKEHDYYTDGLDSEEPEGKYYRFRQFQPSYCQTQPKKTTLSEQQGIYAIGCNVKKGATFDEDEWRGALKPHKTDLAPEETPWNLTAKDQNDLPNEAFGWIDNDYLSGKSEDKSLRKLPHHMRDMKCVWRAVAAAMAVLRGARGGANIPEKDKSGVYRHLAGHYKQFDKEVPPPPGQKAIEEEDFEQEESGAAPGAIARDEKVMVRAPDPALVRAIADMRAEIEEVARKVIEQERDRTTTRQAADLIERLVKTYGGVR